MTHYADRFTKVAEHEFGVEYHWAGWNIYWDYISRTGQLYNARDYCVGTADDIETLAQDAAEREAQR